MLRHLVVAQIVQKSESSVRLRLNGARDGQYVPSKRLVQTFSQIVQASVDHCRLVLRRRVVQTIDGYPLYHREIDVEFGPSHSQAGLCYSTNRLCERSGIVVGRMSRLAFVLSHPNLTAKQGCDAYQRRDSLMSSGLMSRVTRRAIFRIPSDARFRRDGSRFVGRRNSTRTGRL